MACQASFCCQFLGAGEFKIALNNEIAVKLRQRRQGQAQFFAPFTLLQQVFHTRLRMWRECDTAIVVVSSPSETFACASAPSSICRCPLAVLVRRLQIMGLTST